MYYKVRLDIVLHMVEVRIITSSRFASTAALALLQFQPSIKNTFSTSLLYIQLLTGAYISSLRHSFAAEHFINQVLKRNPVQVLVISPLWFVGNPGLEASHSFATWCNRYKSAVIYRQSISAGAKEYLAGLHRMIIKWGDSGTI